MFANYLVGRSIRKKAVQDTFLETKFQLILDFKPAFRLLFNIHRWFILEVLEVRFQKFWNLVIPDNFAL